METILLVEDNPNQAMLYGEELAEEGYRVLWAKDGRAALDIVREGQPDAMVFDICLADTDGPEVLRAILQIWPNLPVIVNTASPTLPHLFSNGVAWAWVLKSSDLSELKRCIREALCACDTTKTFKGQA